MINSFIKLTNQQNAYEIAMHVARTTNLLKILNEDKTIEGINKYENIAQIKEALTAKFWDALIRAIKQ